MPEAQGAGPDYPCLRHLCFSVGNLDEKLKAMGEEAKLTRGPLDLNAFVPGMKACWIADPDGNIVELNQGYTD